jgi:hypothetical protein
VERRGGHIALVTREDGATQVILRLAPAA